MGYTKFNTTHWNFQQLTNLYGEIKFSVLLYTKFIRFIKGSYFTIANFKRIDTKYVIFFKCQFQNLQRIGHHWEDIRNKQNKTILTNQVEDSQHEKHFKSSKIYY